MIKKLTTVANPILKKHYEKINKEKKSTIQWWSDFRYARYDATRMVLMQQLRELKVLYKEVERADLSEQAAIDGASTEPPF